MYLTQPQELGFYGTRNAQDVYVVDTFAFVADEDSASTLSTFLIPVAPKR